MKIQSAAARILTDRPSGHTLNRRQVLSPDRQWCVFDSRNNDPDIGLTQTIERLQLQSGEIEVLYSVAHNPLCSPPSVYGPGVGAAAYHPLQDKVVFIHGLHNCSSERPYAMTRRFGAILDIATQSIQPLESRSLREPITDGSLSGGSHAHSWSPSGNRVSFTYDDAIHTDQSRTVGFGDLSFDGMLEGARNSSPEEFQGAASCFLVARCHAESYLKQAVEECWVGEDRIAFLGRVAGPEANATRNELFLAYLPSREGIGAEKCFAVGQAGSRIEQLSDFSSFPYPGVQGPRHWLVADPQGEWVYSLCKDSLGIVQLVRVHSVNKSFEFVTELPQSIEGQCAISRDGRFVSFVSGDCIHLLNTQSGRVVCVSIVVYQDKLGRTLSSDCFEGGWVGAPHFIDNHSWIINRYVKQGGQAFLQIVQVTIE